MNARSEAECYTRYRATARRFELFGAAILAAGVLCYTAFGDSVKWPGVALGAVGLCAFALGAVPKIPTASWKTPVRRSCKSSSNFKRNSSKLP